MKPVNTQYTTTILNAPDGWDTNRHGTCIGLPVLETEDPYLYSWWELSFKERIKILFGWRVRLCVVGRTHPPVALHVDNTTD